MSELPRDKVKIGGLYSHFKGDQYRVTDLVHSSEDYNQILVVYYNVLEPKEHRAARPLEMFIEEVDKPEYNYRGPRFAYVPGMDDPPDWKLTAIKLVRDAQAALVWDPEALEREGVLDHTEVLALEAALLRYYPARNLPKP